MLYCLLCPKLLSYFFTLETQHLDRILHKKTELSRGTTATALADYDKAIAHAKRFQRFQDKPPVVSSVPRTIGGERHAIVLRARAGVACPTLAFCHTFLRFLVTFLPF